MWSNILRCSKAKVFYVRKFSKLFNELLIKTEKVSQALFEDKPVIALESAVITHGMPWPTNFQMAMELELIVEEEGVTPATIGIMNGKIKAGFSYLELEELACSINTPVEVAKVSRHNIYKCRNMKYGGTTVSGTMIAAHMLGINIFGTGGIGGVHRDVESTMDISADLRELGRTPICVVSSGVKSFLDIRKTLEFLETEGVFVCTFNSKDFPSFFSHSSGIKSPNNLESIPQIASLIQDMNNMKLGSGMLVAIPFPRNLEQERNIIEEAIAKGLENAQLKNIKGSHVTPYVLNQVNELTNGKSLMLNIELIKNNVRIAAKLAHEYHKLKQFNKKSDEHVKREFPKEKSQFAVIGGCIVDSNRIIKDPSVVNLETIIPRATYDCSTEITCGGVGRNLAEVFHKLNDKCYFLSVLGKDYNADYIMKNSSSLDFSRVNFTDNFETANCSIMSCQNNEILFHVGNLSIFQMINLEYLKNHLEEIKNHIKLICIDCNLTEPVMEYVITFAKMHGVQIFVEPTDILLVHKPISLAKRFHDLRFPIDIISPNIFEFIKIVENVNDDNLHFQFDKSKMASDAIFDYIKMIIVKLKLLDLIPTWLIKLESKGIVFASQTETFFIEQSATFIPKNEIIKTSGAGDCLASCALYLKFEKNLSWKESIAGSLRLVKESLIDWNTVPTSIKIDDYSETEVKKWTEEMFRRKILIYYQ